jgi:hypothetical protein
MKEGPQGKSSSSSLKSLELLKRGSARLLKMFYIMGS